jgi:hypothetical protein
MKNTLALLLGGLMVLGFVAPSTSEATTVVVTTGPHYRHAHRVWIPGHHIWRHHHRVWIPGHWAYR